MCLSLCIYKVKYALQVGSISQKWELPTLPVSAWQFMFFLHVCILGHFSRVQLFVTPSTVAHQGSLSMGFSRQEY